MEGVSSIQTAVKYDFAVMNLAQDTTDEQTTGMKNMISSVPAPPQRGHGDILDAIA
jgi:hypothetical protein